MSEQPDQFDELRVLLGRLIDDELDGADRARLADWLRHDAAARNYYLRYLLTDTALQVLHQAPAAGADRSTGFQPVGAGRGTGFQPVGQGRPGTAALPAWNGFDEVRDPSSMPRPLPVIDPVSAGRPFLGVSLCYAFAALLIGAGALAAWAFRAPVGRGAVSVAKDNRQPAAAVVAPAPLVGKVTQVVGGQWGGRLKVGTEVPLGSQLAFESGLVEISYHNGARIMLQGPAIFDAESPQGGFLEFGTLGALAFGRPGETGSKGKGAERPAPAAASRPRFCVRTPSAIVTSSGAEVRVCVGRSGESQLYVFRGLAHLQGPHCEETLDLRDNSWAISQVLGDGTGLVTYQRGEPPESLTRRVPWREPGVYSGEAAQGKQREVTPPTNGDRTLEEPRGT